MFRGDIPELIGTITPLNSCFVLTDPNDPLYQYFHQLRLRFGHFLHEASVSLSRQGEENTVDAVQILVCSSFSEIPLLTNGQVRSIRTYMMDYGDSKDRQDATQCDHGASLTSVLSYFVNEEQLTADKNVARHYAGQKVWPRAVYARKARYYNAARMRWNSLERIRGPVEDKLIDDLVEWSTWHYPTIRQSSQSYLETISTVCPPTRSAHRG